MPNGLEIIKAAIDDFREIQEYMFLAKEENATRNMLNSKRNIFH